MNDQVKERITELLNKRFEETPFFLVNIKRPSPNRVSVFIDHDERLKIEDCAKISRFLEEYLDEELPLGEKYTLEVSSPGMFNPMLLVRQYKKRIGSSFELTLKEGKSFKAKLINVKHDDLIFEKQGTKKNPETEEINIKLDDIKKAKLKFNFNKKQKMR